MSDPGSDGSGIAGCPPLAVAEDIDLFVAQTPAEAGIRPDVLIILDNTGNWNTAFNNEMAALVATFDALPLDEFNIGLMFFGAREVGYVRAAIRPMDATQPAALQRDDRQPRRYRTRSMANARARSPGRSPRRIAT